MRIYNRGDAETLSLRTRSNFPRVSASLRLILILTVTLTACSVPNLEEPQCTEARDMVKRFYSFHFGNDMRLTPANVRAREQFLTPRLVSRLVSTGEPAKDYFTATENFPKAFRLANARSIPPTASRSKYCCCGRTIRAAIKKRSGSWHSARAACG